MMPALLPAAGAPTLPDNCPVPAGARHWPGFPNADDADVMSSEHENRSSLVLPAADEQQDDPCPENFDQFLAWNYRALVRYLRTCTHSYQDAEDAAQESLARLLRYRNSQPPAAWKPLLFRIASNVVHDHHRHQKNNPCRYPVPLEDVAQRIPDQQAGPERSVEDRRRLQKLLATIEHLPPKCRQVFLLSRFHAMSNQAIAERCGISVRMVEKQISKALATCRRRLEADE